MSRCFHWSWGFTSLVALTVLSACATPTVPIRRGAVTPHAVGVVCLGAAGTPVALDDEQCNDDGIRALVSGKDSLSAAIPVERTWLDVNLATPGYTPLHMPDMPGAIAVDASAGVAYVAIPLLGWVARVDVAHLYDYTFSLLDWHDVGVAARDLLLVQEPEPRLYMADAEHGTVAWLALSNWGKPVAAKSVAVGGQPVSLAWSKLSQRIYIGHLAAGYVSVLDPALGDVQAISLTAQCGNGLDDDGDGLIDARDSGCDDAGDPVEGNPEVAGRCQNGVDDDGDGQTDKDDWACTGAADATPTDACRNGIDDDGDGLTDYAPLPGGTGDPGCSGWGDTSEWSDQALCASGALGCKTFRLSVQAGASKVQVSPATTLCGDGVDNDGDGKTDSLDPDCAVAGNATEGPGACADGLDNDGDGTTDTLDPECYNRASAGEIATATQIRTSVASTFDGRFVVIADRTRHALLVVDAVTNQLLQPQPGQGVPFVRASRLDLRDGVPGLTLPEAPLALAPVQILDRVQHGEEKVSVYKPQMAVSLSQTGVLFLQFQPAGDDQTVAVDIVQLAQDATPTLTAGRPTLLVPGSALDLPSTIPTRFAAFGWSVTTDADNKTSYYGLTPTTQYAEQRAETWRFTREALLPNGAGTHGRLVAADVLADPAANFCAMGALPGDMLQLQVQASASCPGGTYDFPIVTVGADQLAFDPASGLLDVPVTTDNQLSYDSKARTPWQGDLRACLAPGGIRYTVRAGSWLVQGSRTGVLSTRRAIDGVCAALDPAWAAGARVAETTLQPGKTAADVLQCPYAGDALDPAVWLTTPLVHPQFTALLSPGCDSSTYDENGNRIVRLVPSIREAQWLYQVTVGAAPRITTAGGNIVAMASGPRLDTLYVVDEGSGLLQFVRVSDGTLLDTPLD